MNWNEEKKSLIDSINYRNERLVFSLTEEGTQIAKKSIEDLLDIAYQQWKKEAVESLEQKLIPTGKWWGAMLVLGERKKEMLEPLSTPKQDEK